jgi:hypothetical protein
VDDDAMVSPREGIEYTTETTGSTAEVVTGKFIKLEEEDALAVNGLDNTQGDTAHAAVIPDALATFPLEHGTKLHTVGPVLANLLCKGNKRSFIKSFFKMDASDSLSGKILFAPTVILANEAALALARSNSARYRK